jgi:predicted transcriptional regulator of viral defense system
VEVLTIKDKGLLELYKRLEHGETYSYKDIKTILVNVGASIQYANVIIEELEYYGVLERVRRGVYRVNKTKLAKLAKSYGLLR